MQSLNYMYSNVKCCKVVKVNRFSDQRSSLHGKNTSKITQKGLKFVKWSNVL